MAKLIIEVDAKDAKRVLAGVKKGLKDVGSQAKVTAKQTRQVSDSTKQLSTTLTRFLVPAMALAFAKKTIGMAIEQAQAVAQVEAAIKSTGMSAGFTTAELEKMASALQRTTTAGDEAILKMQSLLLTFKSIKGEEFERTTEAVVNLATRMGSLESAALLLGKALDDPAKRASELGRSGIVLSDIQMDLIKSLDATGQRAKDHAIILDELETQFGGAAQAAADAAGGGLKQFGNALGDLMEHFGAGLVEQLDMMARAMEDIAASDDAAETVKGLGEAVGGLLAAVGLVIISLKELRSVSVDVGDEVGGFIGGAVGDWIRALDSIFPLLDKWGKYLGMSIRDLGLNEEALNKNAAAMEKLRDKFA